ncbi:MAG TPA: class I SAM-dependent methyltransferase, partial [Myxococcaceae bacterium]|nr:class I SAM-dependent methyltransferase [Myxococcaceae bacterium]
MSHEPPNDTRKPVAELVAALSEVYQPILGHPEFDARARRTSTERLERMLPIAEHLAKKRPLRVLDIGCAQGYFSLSLAQRGLTREVVGIDADPVNIELCQRLASDMGARARFHRGAVTPEFILENGPFDVVFGLNVFHHITHSEGLERALGMLRVLSQSSGLVFLELALKEEGLYWAKALPSDYREYLAPFPFWHKLRSCDTHLTSVVRPLLVCSSRYAVVNDQALPFDEVLTTSHEFERGAHVGTRRYFLSNEAGLITKRYEKDSRGTINRDELNNEREVLERYAGRISFLPRLLAFEETDEWMLLTRTAAPGKRLTQLVAQNQPYDADQAIATVLDQLVELEQHGLFHNDLRIWNVLFDAGEKRWTLIDFGAISSKPTEPVFDRFLTFCYATLTREQPANELGLWPRRNPTHFPARYQPMVDQLSRCPAQELSFARIRDWLQGKEPGAPKDGELASLDRKVTHLHAVLEEAFDTQVAPATKAIPELRLTVDRHHHTIHALDERTVAAQQETRERFAGQEARLDAHNARQDARLGALDAHNVGQDNRLNGHEAQLASLQELVRQLQHTVAQQGAAQHAMAEQNDAIARQVAAGQIKNETLRRELDEA